MSQQYKFSNIPFNQNELYQSLEKNGVLDITKAYLRSNLIETLKSKSTAFSNTQASLSQSLPSLNSNPLIKLGLSLVNDFLSKLKLEYTLSTFQSESKSLLNASIPFSEGEMLGLLNVNLKDFNEYKDETVNIFLLHLLREKSKLLKEESQVQTEINMLNNPITLMPSAEKVKFLSLEEQLKNIDQKYNNKLTLENLLPSKYSEEKFIKYKAEVEQRYKQDLENQMKRFKDIEMSQMRIEENKKYLAKIEKLRDEYEKEFKEKYELLKQKEIDMNKRIESKEKEIDTITYNNRQKFQEELNLLKTKEKEMNKKIDNEMNKLKLEQDKLKFKEKEAEYVKENSLKKINDQVEQFKLEYEKKFFKEKMDFETEKMNFQTQNASQLALMDKYNAKERDYYELKEETDNIKAELKSLRSAYENAMKENESLRIQVNSLSLQAKKQSDTISKKDLERDNLREEVKLLKETIDTQKNIFTNTKNNQQDFINKLNQQVNELSMNRSILNNSTSNMNTVPNLYTNGNTELEKKVKQMEGSIAQYKEMINKLMEEKKGNKVQPKERTRSANVQVPQSIKYNSTINFGRKIMNYPDRRETLAKLEEEELRLKSQIRNEFRNITKKEVPVMVVSEEEIKQIKKNNYFNTVVVNEEREKFINAQNKKLEQKLKPNEQEVNILYNEGNQQQTYIVPSVQTILNKDTNVPSQPQYTTNSNINNGVINRTGTGNNNKSILSNHSQIEDKKSIHHSIDNNKNIQEKEDEKEIKPNKEILPTPVIVSDYQKQQSLRENNTFTDNEISVENITNDSKEWNLNSDKSKKETTPVVQKPSSIKNQSVKNNNSITESIKEEIDDSKSHSISNNQKDSSSNKYSPAKVNNTSNKFQNINYDNSQENINNDDEIEEYGDDFVDDIDNIDKNRNSLDLNAYNNASLGHQSIKGKMNNSISSIHNKSNTTSYIDKFLQSNKQSNIEENIEEELSVDNSKKNSSKKENESNNSSSNQYNDFVSSNVLKKESIASSGGNFGGSEEIKEDIAQSEDSDGYSPY